MNQTKKCWREKVVAEVTLAHLLQFASEAGTPLSQEEAIAFLNQNGRAYEMWKHMMYAAEEYVKTCMELQLEVQQPLSRNTSLVN